VALQERLRVDIIAGHGPETLLLLEHDPVITLGRGAAPGDVLVPDRMLADRGIAMRRTTRGGEVTYHGPGQLVGYPVVRLRAGVRAHVERMAAALAAVLASLGVLARYRREAPGLWVESAPGGAAMKICAFGIHVHRRVAIHGFALNLGPDLDAFSLIVPCGLPGAAVTSVRALRGTAPTPAAIAPAVAAALGSAFGLELAEA
jgi:lipoate-protein ligase B